jgi:pyruvate dehydrogenase E1 component alpha subunit
MSGGEPAELDAERARSMLATMWRIRLFEEEAGRLKRADQVYGLIHISIGQEATATAICSQLRDDDVVYTGHRGHGHTLAKGADVDRTMAELMGKADGLCRGLGGSMHLVDKEHGLYGATGVVGGNVPIALGSALASRLRGDDSVVVVYFGDGAVQAGVFNETVNLATLWGAPLILVCENNGFAEFTSREEHTKVARVCDVVAPYGLDRVTVDGGDAVAIHEAFAGFLARARAGEGPFLIEAMTHRRSGHYEGDPGQYRERLAADEWNEKDPVLRFERHGLERGWWTQDELAGFAARAAEDVRRAVERGLAGPDPEVGLAERLTYAA